MTGSVVSFESVIENGMIRLPEVYREAFTVPVLVTVQENRTKKTLTSDEITARLNEIYSNNPAVIDDDIMLAQYNLVGDGDW